jgi:hypothetical protein
MEYGDRFFIEITRSTCYPSSQLLIFIRTHVIRPYPLNLNPFPDTCPLFLLHPYPGGLPMPRIARFVRPDTPTVYHVISRTALDGFPLGDREKDHLLDTIRFLSRFYFAGAEYGDRFFIEITRSI